MLQALLTSVCNIGEGITDAYDVILHSIAKHKGSEPEEMVTNVAIDFARALQERPALRRIVAVYAASVIALDRFAQGEDFNTALNESRTFVMNSLEDPMLVFELNEIYSAKKDAVIALMEELDNGIDFDVPKEDQYGVIFKIIRKLIATLRAPINEYADAT